MANKPTHKASLMREEKDKDGKLVTKFHEICAIWENDKGNMFINIPKGMSLQGKMIITPVKDNLTQPPQETIYTDDEWLPF